MRCLAHIINLACQGAIKHLDRAEICLVNSQNSDVFEDENESDEEDEYPVDTLQLLDKVTCLRLVFVLPLLFLLFN